MQLTKREVGDTCWRWMMCQAGSCGRRQLATSAAADPYCSSCRNNGRRGTVPLVMFVDWTDRHPDGLETLDGPLTPGRVAADSGFVVVASDQRCTN